MPATLRWLLIQTSTPRRTRSARDVGLDVGETDHEVRSSLRISPIFADVNALTFGLSVRAIGGRTVNPLMPTMRSCSLPSAHRTSVGSSVRADDAARADRHRAHMAQHPPRPAAVGVALVQVALVQAELRAVPELHRRRARPEAGPARRSRHVAAGEARSVLGVALVELSRGRAASAIAGTPTRRSWLSRGRLAK